MQTIVRSAFTTVKTEGGLLPADLLQRIADGNDLPGLRPADYHLFEGERLNEAVNRAWNRCTGAWKGFKEQSDKLPATDSGTTLTRERWLLVLFQELGFGRLPALRSGLSVGDATFPISHLWQTTPIHLVTFRHDLDKRSEVSTAVKRSPHSLMQELLNRSPEHQWGVISNGLQLRILRDNVSLRRAAFVEFDLAAIMQYELYAEFALLWLVCHQSRFEPFAETTKVGAEKAVRSTKAEEADEAEEEVETEPEQAATTCWLEVWSKTAAEHGTRALDALRDGVKEAIEALGSGFLAHRENGSLRAKLSDGVLRSDDYYHQLRRMVYRLIFLAVAEDRDLLLVHGTSADARKLYTEHYSLRRLRSMSAVVRGGPHPDLHRQLRMLFLLLREGYPDLGLPGLGSFLFSSRSTPDLDNLELANQHLLTAVRALSFAVEGRVRRPVDFRNLDSEELGSIYESLLELHPEVNLGAATFALNTGAGSERKTSGSHYTPTSLVESLLDTALEPVVTDRLAKAEEQWRKGGDRNPDKLRELQEKAILSIKVLDAATGSGHMLIGGGRRLARHLARIRTGDDEPSPEALRHAMRDVVRHCLYGVDLNDLAVELCKVALWMESMESGKPLSFLDAHIQCGNSLIGVTPGLDISEVPDNAFQPVTGDDKTTATGLRRRNKKEREGQMALQFGDAEAPSSSERHAGKRAQMVSAIEDLAEDAVGQVAEKERSYVEYLQSTEYRWARWEADTWTAAFFWPIPAGDAGRMAAPTQEVMRAVRAGKLKQHDGLLREARRTAKQHRFFHWALQFPDVFQRAKGGFDVVLMNPPWDKIKLEDKEWFASKQHTIAKAIGTNQRHSQIQQLADTDPGLFNEFLVHKRGNEAQVKYLRNSNHYPLCGTGDINSFAVFSELVLRLQAASGQTGIIVPSGIATDNTTKLYFQHLMQSNQLVSLYDFENRDGIFPAVHRSFKFCLMTLSGASRPAEHGATFVFFARNVDNTRKAENQFQLDARDIALLNPNSLTCPTFRSGRDAEVTKTIYQGTSVLVKETNPPDDVWQVEFYRMFHTSDDAHLFRTELQLSADGWTRSGTLFTRDGERYLPLLEGKMVDAYNDRYASITVNAENFQRKAYPDPLAPAELNDPASYNKPQFWVNDVSVKNASKSFERRPLLVYKRVTTASSERTVKACVPPYDRSALNDKLPVIVGPDERQLLWLLGNMNSIPYDFVARQKTGYVNLARFVVEQLPVISPSTYSLGCSWLRRLSLGEWIISRVIELSYTHWNLQTFACACGYEGPPFRWDEERRFLLRCELDAAYFHLYAIEREDVDYILETFPIVKRKDIAKYGEYRTKRVILEMYDEMDAATCSGVGYQTRLDPPPADPRLAHGG